MKTFKGLMEIIAKEVVDEGFERSSAEFLKQHKAEMEKHKQDQKAKKERMDMNLKNYQAGQVRASDIKEAKEKTEYDYEGDMARGQLQSIINNAQKVHDMLEDNDNLPEWVQSKITLSEDYISTVANYMMSELDEAMSGGNYASFHKETGKIGYIGNKRDMINHVKSNSDHARGYTGPNKKVGDIFGGYPKKTVKEEVEQIEEGKMDKLSLSNLWHKHAEHSYAADQGFDHGSNSMRLNQHAAKAIENHVTKKHGSQVSKDMISHSDAQTAHSEYLGGKEAKDALKDAAQLRKKHGIQSEETEQIEEGRPSQQHPLEGHPYHKKTNAELEYISKDARAAGEAMKSHGTASGRAAENKYADQANDSATVRHFRKTSGMPSWYKKKYDLNESELEESNGYKQKSDVNHGSASVKAPGTGEKLSFLNKMYPNKKKQPNGAEFAAQRRVNRIADSGRMDEEKKDDDKSTPFAGPYKKTPGSVTDKSGAKHTRMSVAKDLAKKALKKVSSSMVQKEQVEKSFKAKLIKKISKGKESPDKFQAEPELSKNTASGKNSYTDE